VGSDRYHASEAIPAGNVAGSEAPAMTDLFPRQNRDEVEDEQLQSNQLTEGMPTTIAGFKDHPLCVLSYTVFSDRLTKSSNSIKLRTRASHKADRSNPPSR